MKIADPEQGQPVCRLHQAGGRASAGADQRHPRRLEDPGRQALGRSRAVRRRRRSSNPASSSSRRRPRKRTSTVKSQHRPATPPLFADPLRLKQILINILGNAIKFTPDGGRVMSRSTSAGPEAVVAIAVTDTGAGMSPSEIETAMRPFGQVDSGFNKRHEGTGLGLPISVCAGAAAWRQALTIESEKGTRHTRHVIAPGRSMTPAAMQRPTAAAPRRYELRRHAHERCRHTTPRPARPEPPIAGTDGPHRGGDRRPRHHPARCRRRHSARGTSSKSPEIGTLLKVDTLNLDRAGAWSRRSARRCRRTAKTSRNCASSKWSSSANCRRTSAASRNSSGAASRLIRRSATSCSAPTRKNSPRPMPAIPKRSIRIGHIQQDPTIPAMVKIDEMLGKHFAILGHDRHRQILFGGADPAPHPREESAGPYPAARCPPRILAVVQGMGRSHFARKHEPAVLAPQFRRGGRNPDRQPGQPRSRYRNPARTDPDRQAALHAQPAQGRRVRLAAVRGTCRRHQCRRRYADPLPHVRSRPASRGAYRQARPRAANWRPTSG